MKWIKAIYNPPMIEGVPRAMSLQPQQGRVVVVEDADGVMQAQPSYGGGVILTGGRAAPVHQGPSKNKRYRLITRWGRDPIPGGYRYDESVGGFIGPDETVPLADVAFYAEEDLDG